MSEPSQDDSIFVVPALGQYLIYAPLHNLAALVDGLAVRHIRDGLLVRGDSELGALTDLVGALSSRVHPPPEPKAGAFSPAFLGLIPTRGCNLGCAYCGFQAAEDPDDVMDLELVRDAIDWYLDLAHQQGARTAEIHFFGGEPFCAEEVLDFSFHYARFRASEASQVVRFEVATNGAYDDSRCRWAADSLDSIILSLDGAADIQDLHRPFRNGSSSFGRVARSAAILSSGAAELSFRVCVTADTIQYLPGIAGWLCQGFRPVSVGFEPLQPSAPSRAAGLQPPDPWTFAQAYCEAAWILEAHGVEAVYAAADITARRVTFCPVGQDVPIVSPDGTIAACYLLARDWEEKGLDLRLGKLAQGEVFLDSIAVAAARGLNVLAEPTCSGCFCKWHCAGGCHVNHVLPDNGGSYDRLCIQTRILALRNILKGLDRNDLMVELLKDREALEHAVFQSSDLIARVGLSA